MINNKINKKRLTERATLHEALALPSQSVYPRNVHLFKYFGVETFYLRGPRPAAPELKDPKRNSNENWRRPRCEVDLDLDISFH